MICVFKSHVISFNYFEERSNHYICSITLMRMSPLSKASSYPMLAHIIVKGNQTRKFSYEIGIYLYNILFLITYLNLF